MAFDAEMRPPRHDAGDFPALFDPISFFKKPTVGHAVIRGPSGRLLGRCVMETWGEDAVEHDAVHFDERYSFEGRAPDLMHWAVRRTQGGLEAQEVSVIGPVRSQLAADEWRVRFRRRANPPAAGPVLLYDVRFNRVAEDLVLKAMRLSFLGVPLATLTGHHRWA